MNWDYPPRFPVGSHPTTHEIHGKSGNQNLEIGRLFLGGGGRCLMESGLTISTYIMLLKLFFQ